MNKIASRAVLALSMVFAVLGTACTQMPTEKQGVADVRPQISFQLANPELGSAQVLVDGLAMGEARQYLAGVASLRLRPGTHELQVVSAGRTVLSERFYIADGVNKTFVLP